MSKLYVIGNGFDANHGLKSLYSDFLKYMCIYHHDDYHRIGTMFCDGNPSTLWKDFENNLIYFDVNKSVKNNLQKLISEARQNPKRNLNILTSLENACDTLYIDLCDLFRSWVCETLVNNVVDKKYVLDCSDYFLSFNYTNILETVYGIPSSHICYIHGNLVENELRIPIFGHDISKENVKDYITLDSKTIEIITCECNEDPDNVKDVYVNLLTDFQKKKEEPMCLLLDFLKTIGKDNIDSLYILGHSMGDSDKSYFEVFNRSIGVKTPIFVSYFGAEKDYINMTKVAKQRFFFKDQIKVEKMENLLNKC